MLHYLPRKARRSLDARDTELTRLAGTSNKIGIVFQNSLGGKIQSIWIVLALLSQTVVVVFILFRNTCDNHLL